MLFMFAQEKRQIVRLSKAFFLEMTEMKPSWKVMERKVMIFFSFFSRSHGKLMVQEKNVGKSPGILHKPFSHSMHDK